MYRRYPCIRGKLGSLIGTGIPAAAPIPFSVTFRRETAGRLKVSESPHDRPIKVAVGEDTLFLHHPEVEAIYLTEEEWDKIEESVRWYEDAQGVMIHSMTLISKISGRGYGIKMKTNRGAFISFVKWKEGYFYWDTFKCQKVC